MNELVKVENEDPHRGVVGKSAGPLVIFDSVLTLTALSKFFSFLIVFAVSIKWAKSGGDIKTEIWHENGRRESPEALDHTILHRISVRIQPRRRHFAKPLVLKSQFFLRIM